MGNPNLQEALNFVNTISVNDFVDCSFINDPSSIGSTILQNLDTKGLDTNEPIDIAIIAVPEQGSSEKPYQSAQKIRENLYLLKQITAGLHLADFGNLKMGPSFNETMFALKEFCSLLSSQGTRVIALGPDKRFTLGLYKAMCDFEGGINVTIVDSHIPFSVYSDDIQTNNYIDQILDQKENKIYNLSFLGYQSYFVDQRQIAKISECNYEHYRLGYIRSCMEEIEPVFRDSDVASFDLGAIRLIDAPGQKKGSPNGLYTEEACQLARYAGISDRLRFFALFGYDASMDTNTEVTAMLSAQIIWYFIEGHSNRKKEIPQGDSQEFNKYLIPIDEFGFPIVFYKSNKSDRWWLEIDSSTKQGEEAQKIIVACSESDYKKASRNEVPNRWWSNFKKIE